LRESVIERHLVRSVEALGGRAVKFTSSANRGVPDRMCLFPNGIIIFVECKAPGKTLDPLQVVWFKVLHELGFTRVMVDSKEKVDALMRYADRVVKHHTPQ